MLAKPKKAVGRPRGFDADQVLNKAMRVFFQHGYEGTGSRDLQAATGLTAPSLYNAFGSKNDLFLAALELYVQSGLDYMIDDLAEGARGLDDIDGFLDRAWATFADGQGPMGCMVLNTRGEFGRSAPDILAICDRFTDRQVAAIRAAFRRAADLGEIDPDMTDRCVLGFRMMLNGVLHLARTDGSGPGLRAAYDAVRQIVQGWRLA